MAVEKGPCMLWNLDALWLTMAVTMVVIASFFLGSAIDALVREDGFGANGNMVIIAGGFFLAIMAANSQGYNLRELHEAIMVGLGGSFVCLAALTLFKALAARL
jgi:hypothetical protein